MIKGGVLRSKDKNNNPKIFCSTDLSLSHAFKALSDVNRYRIFRALSAQPRLSIRDITTILNLSVPLVSLHMAVLVHAKLLRKERVGKKIYGRLGTCNLFVRSLTQRF